MPLGDSITFGSGSTGNTQIPGDPQTGFGLAGYRKPVIDSLVMAGYISDINTSGLNVDFDFVGTQSDGFLQVDQDTFDMDHEGHSGWHASNPGNTSISLSHNLNSFLTSNPPNIILLHIGTNDIENGDNANNLVSEVDNLLDIIDNFDLSIYVILAKIINRSDVLTNSPKSIITTQYNSELEAMANIRISNGDLLSVVDMENGAGINYEIDATYPFNEGKDMRDNLHPNNSGYIKMAGVWFNKIKELLIPVLTVPVDDSTFAPVDITLNWSPALGANSYRLQISTSPTFADTLFDDSTLTNTFYTYGLLEFNTTYYWRVRGKINTGSSPYSEIRSFTTTPQSVLLSTKIFLEGPYSGSGTMSTALNSLGYLPTKHPYDSLPWEYADEDSVVPGFFGPNTSIVDWVLLELRDTSDNSQYIARRAALLKDNGSIVDTDGVSPVYFDSVSPGNYYIVINHRNHLAVMNSTPLNLNALDSEEFDFTSSEDNFYGNEIGAKEIETGIWGMIAGDANSSNIITFGDKSPINADHLSEGYFKSDVNLSGIVSFGDKTLVNSNHLSESIVP